MDWVTPLELGYRGENEELLSLAAEARTLADEGRHGAALEILWNLLIPARRRGDDATQAFVYIHIGRVYRDWMWDMAKKFYLEGMEAAQCCGYTTAELVACCSLGELYQAWREPHRALAQFERSLALAEAEGDMSIQHVVLQEMAACCRAKGDRAREQELQRRADEVGKKVKEAAEKVSASMTAGCADSG